MSHLRPAHVIVVGAGIGGLATALDLACRGCRVTVIEAVATPGGKMRELEIQGRRIASGPTVLTMPWIFEELFEAAGSRMDEHLVLYPAEVLARHAWPDGSTLDLFADIQRSATAIEDFADKAEARRYLAFCAHAERVYRSLYRPFIRSQRPGMLSLVARSGLRGLIDLWHIRPFETLWDRLGKAFRDPRLQSLFGRYATYCGSSPLKAPATLMLIAHVEQCGVWQVEGGIQRLAQALSDLIVAHGGVIHCDAPVSEVIMDAGRAAGVRLDNGEILSADAIVANVDVAAIQTGRLGRQLESAVPPYGPKQRSLSAVCFSLLARTSGFELAHHNVFFPDDYPREFRDIFEHGRLPAKPAVYICAQDRGQGSAPGDNEERLFMITNAPANGDRSQYEEATVVALEAAAFELLEHCGLRIDSPPDQRIVTSPADFNARFPATGGALYGPAAHGWRSSFTRAGARSRIPGLYLAGGSVHPGPGVPMVAASGRLAAAAVAADLGIGAGS